MSGSPKVSVLSSWTVAPATNHEADVASIGITAMPSPRGKVQLDLDLQDTWRDMRGLLQDMPLSIHLREAYEHPQLRTAPRRDLAL